MGVKALITRKVGMTSTISDNGVVQAITILSFMPHTITQLKSTKQDGYNAVQVATGHTKKLNKPQVGHYKSAKITPNIAKEFKIAEDQLDLNVGDHYTADVFNVGDKVDVTGISKGKGWAGTIKRHNMKRGRKTHGGRSYRRIGSIGSMYPQKIFKGKRMAGHLGHDQVTVKNLVVTIVDSENSVIGVSGAVPGPRKGIVVIKEAVS